MSDELIVNINNALAMFKAGKPPSGFTPIPKSKHGGWHKREGAGWQTWYPGHDAPRKAPRDHALTIREMASVSRMETHVKGQKPLPLRYAVARSVEEKHPDLKNHLWHEAFKEADKREPGRYVKPA